MRSPGGDGQGAISHDPQQQQQSLTCWLGGFTNSLKAVYYNKHSCKMIARNKRAVIPHGPCNPQDNDDFSYPGWGGWGSVRSACVLILGLKGLKCYFCVLSTKDMYPNWDTLTRVVAQEDSSLNGISLSFQSSEEERKHSQVWPYFPLIFYWSCWHPKQGAVSQDTWQISVPLPPGLTVFQVTYLWAKSTFNFYSTD